MRKQCLLSLAVCRRTVCFVVELQLHAFVVAMGQAHMAEWRKTRIATGRSPPPGPQFMAEYEKHATRFAKDYARRL